MSYDLYFFELDDTPSSVDRIDEILEQSTAHDAMRAPAGPRMTAFFEELQTRWLPIGTPEGDPPWAADPQLSESGVAMCTVFIVSSQSSQMRSELLQSATRFGLVVYDPQENTITGP
jgi:hypothetical protein